MDAIVESYKLKMKDIEEDLINEIQAYFAKAETIEIPIKSIEDLDKISSGSGFYIILTDMPITNNNCNFSINRKKAIYRGHSRTIRNRVTSHLFNDYYNIEYDKKQEKNKYLIKYNACLKFDEAVDGINLSDSRFSNNNWSVVIHSMNNSTQHLRGQAEMAFDCLYGKPIKSKK